MTALGVVYGDIGTSPLYAFRECFSGHYGIAATPENVLGVLSLIFWSLIIVITLKYVTFILRADNHGEGGILALTALATPLRRIAMSRQRWLVLLGVFGAALLYGDGVITPAISVLSAVEGLNTVTPLLHPYVVPITIVIIIALFMIQRNGTARIGGLFGPIMVVWFAVIAILGVMQIVQAPYVLQAVSPHFGANFFIRNGWHGFLVLGTVFLVVTGGEALYADMGHFGPKPIRLAWFTYVLPALLLNYFGQGALVLQQPELAENSFYMLAPSWALLPLVVLATAATIIASQALISGAFSLTMQAENLGFLPRLQIDHTSETAFGQIYIPIVNWLLMFTCIGVVLYFQIIYASGRGLRHRRYLDDGDHHDHICRGCAQSLAVERALGGCARRLLPCRRPGLLWCEYREDPTGWLVPHCGGALNLCHHDDLETRQLAGGHPRTQPGTHAPAPVGKSKRRGDGARARRCSLFECQSRGGAGRAAGQSEVQPRAARAGAAAQCAV